MSKICFSCGKLHSAIRIVPCGLSCVFIIYLLFCVFKFPKVSVKSRRKWSLNSRGKHVVHADKFGHDSPVNKNAMAERATACWLLARLLPQRCCYLCAPWGLDSRVRRRLLLSRSSPSAKILPRYKPRLRWNDLLAALRTETSSSMLSSPFWLFFFFSFAINNSPLFVLLLRSVKAGQMGTVICVLTSTHSPKVWKGTEV